MFQAGPVESTRRPKDANGRPKSFAFIVYKHECSVPYALELFKGTKLYNCLIHLNSTNKISNIPVLQISSHNQRRHSYPKPASRQTHDRREARYISNLRQIEKNESYRPRNSSNIELLGSNMSNWPLNQNGLNVRGANVSLHSMMDNLYGPRRIERCPQINLDHYSPSQKHYQGMQGQSPRGRYMSALHFNARRHSDWGSRYCHPPPTHLQKQPHRSHRY